ncbi:hypothetical protein COO91_05486 [Nostoc flagelliforme CCNUN1]|uniref:Uncharacterized protein n=1 Tax=Nostoc flagelliforme CCNUN1 TaxID=2038116 RepID=A0A2K8SVN8_9NOSO|nr:hypothetical protein COO91_05486 [Nostoc flagelliforme CCNUN1]
MFPFPWAVNYRMDKSTYQIGEVCQIFAEANPELRGKN